MMMTPDKKRKRRPPPATVPAVSYEPPPRSPEVTPALDPEAAAENVHVVLAEELMARFFKETAWSFLVVTDGSGSRRGHACGWGSVILNRTTAERQVISGGFNDGTVNIGETMAVVHSLWTIAESQESMVNKLVCVITDSEYVANLGNRIYEPKRNRLMWQAVNDCRARGMRIKFFWWERDEIGANKMSHDLAGAARKAVSGSHKGVAQEWGEPETLFSIDDAESEEQYELEDDGE